MARPRRSRGRPTSSGTTAISFIYRQTVGAAAGKDAGDAGWNGREIVAFRLHLPSKIRYHNTRREVGRGNILVWEQPLADRLRGVPLELDARMDAQSILYRTLLAVRLRRSWRSPSRSSS